MSLSDHVATITGGKTTEDRAPACDAIAAMVAELSGATGGQLIHCGAALCSNGTVRNSN